MPQPAHSPDHSESDVTSDSDDGLEIIIPEGPEATIVDYQQATKQLQLLVNKRVSELPDPPQLLPYLIQSSRMPQPAHSPDRSESDVTSNSDDGLEIIIPEGPEATIVDYQQASTSARTTILNTLRDVMGKILGLPGEYFETEYSCESEPDICVMLGITIEYSRIYPLLFPALYPDLDVGSKKLFGNWQLAGPGKAHGLLQILKAALFGPKSIQATRKSGAVAWAITVLLFFLSPDISFLGDGPSPSSASILAELDVALAQLDLEVDEPDSHSPPPSPTIENDPGSDTSHAHHPMPPLQDPAPEEIQPSSAVQVTSNTSAMSTISTAAQKTTQGRKPKPKKGKEHVGDPVGDQGAKCRSGRTRA
ncbi:hypothetical protein BDN67DRAFT_985211 [Paxillus ammoniavirescens]|nr:hypothetical protein BDN67DRAFT_985211 [Paxillus ammoniavirescens]